MPLNLKLSSLECSAVWKYNFPQNTGGKCQICRRSIMAPSHEDINSNNLVSRISIGKCGHAYHSECIKNYCKKNVSCPIDFTHWTTQKEIEGPTLVSIKTKSTSDTQDNKIQNIDKEKTNILDNNKIIENNMLNSFNNIFNSTPVNNPSVWTGVPKNPPVMLSPKKIINKKKIKGDMLDDEDYDHDENTDLNIKN
jgi:hypothetical protein